MEKTGSPRQESTADEQAKGIEPWDMPVNDHGVKWPGAVRVCPDPRASKGLFGFRKHTCRRVGGVGPGVSRMNAALLMPA